MARPGKPPTISPPLSSRRRRSSAAHSRGSERRSSHPPCHARNCDSQRKYTSVDQCCLYSCRLNPIVDKGGNVKQSECERPCQGIGSACIPPPLPMLPPPLFPESVFKISS